MCLVNALAPPIFGIVEAHRYRISIPMLGELTNLPTDTLLDIVFVILVGGQPLTLSEVGELEQIQRELQRFGDARIPLENVGIEEIPGMPRPHARPDLRPRFNQSLRCQRTQRLAQHRPADAEALHQFGFTRQRGRRREIAAQYLGAKLVRDASVQIVLDNFPLCSEVTQK